MLIIPCAENSLIHYIAYILKTCEMLSVQFIDFRVDSTNLDVLDCVFCSIANRILVRKFFQHNTVVFTFRKDVLLEGQC
jgi:hypothetical protein